MLRRLIPVGCVVVFAWSLVGACRAAVPASETIFPKTTKLFISAASLDAVVESWNKTQIGQLMADPIMKPFETDFREQLQRKWQVAHQRLGLTWDDFSKVPSGEASVAAIEPAQGAHAQAVFADVTGHEKEAAELIEHVAKVMAEKHATRSEVTIGGVKVTVFTVPKQDEVAGYQTGYFLHDNVLVGVDNLKIIEGMIGRMGREADDSLASVEAFKGITDRCKQAAGDLQPQIRWFVDPFGYADVMRAIKPDRRHREHDLLEILRRQGFTAIQGIGGFVNLALDKRELLHRTMVYAPAVAGAGAEKYKLGARMLKFPNTASLAPPAWIPREIAAFTSFNLKTREAFEFSETLVNEYVGDDVWKDVLEGIRDDPNGAMVDVRKELVGHLGERIVMLSDYHLPITTKSERILIAVEATDSKLLADAIDRMMKIDPNARRRQFNNHVIWEMVEEENALPMVVIENQPGFAEAAPKDESEDGAKEPRLPPNSAVSVADGQLLWSTNIDLMIKILAQLPGQEPLSDSVDFKLVEEELKKYAAAENCAMSFSRTDEEYRPVYELFRAGRMPESETMFGKLLNLMLGEGRSGVPRAPRLDGSKLPDFEAVRRYFGPAGVTIATETNGWFLTGFTLNKQAE